MNIEEKRPVSPAEHAASANAAIGYMLKAVDDTEYAAAKDQLDIHFDALVDQAEEAFDNEFGMKIWRNRTMVAEARIELAEAALREIAGNDPDGMDGFHFVGDEQEPQNCPGCIARAYFTKDA